ncbi:hypothetical protein PAXINDRAFT_75447, partial [Paxillus involutus ATCC 200175]
MIESKNYAGESPLLLAAQNYHLPVVDLLVRKGARVSDEIIHAACTTTEFLDHTPPRALIVKSLLQHGVDHNTSDLHRDTPIHTLLRKLCNQCDCLNTVPLLVAAGYNPKSLGDDGKSTVQIAAEEGHISTARYLLDLGRGASISARTAGGDTVLHVVLRRSVWRSPTACLYMTRLLIDKGCELNVLNSFGESPLHLAVQLGYISIVRLLLDKGA